MILIPLMIASLLTPCTPAGCEGRPVCGPIKWEASLSLYADWSERYESVVTCSISGEVIADDVYIYCPPETATCQAATNP